MADSIDAIAADLETIRDRLRSLTAEQPPIAEPEQRTDDMITPGAAIALFSLSRSTLHRLCVKYPIGFPNGFSIKAPDGKTYSISRSGLDRFLQLYPRRRRNNKARKTPKPGN